MTNFTLGRIGLDADMEDVGEFDHSGGRVSVAFATYLGTIEQANAIRQQLLGYVEFPDEEFVPVTWADDPTADGYYRVLGGDVVPDADSAFDGVYYFRAELERVQGYAAPMIEVGTASAERVNTQSVSGTPKNAVPAASTTWTRYTPSLETYYAQTPETRDSETGDLHVFPLGAPAAFSPVVQYTCEPARFYDGAATLSVGGHVVVGRQIVNDPAVWVLSNGLVKMTPNYSGGDFGVDAASWNGTAWGAPKRFVITGGNPRAYLLAPHTLTVLQNSPEEVRVRFTSTVPGAVNPIILDVRLRRGMYFFACREQVAVNAPNHPGIDAAGMDSAFSVPGGWALPGAYQSTNKVENSSVAFDATGWSTIGGTATGRTVAGGMHGVSFYRATTNAAHTAQAFGVKYGGPGKNLVVAGLTYSHSAYAKNSVGRSMQLEVRHYNASDVLVGSVTTGPAVTISTTQQRVVAENVVAPSGAVRVELTVTGAGATAWVSGRTLDVDAAQTEPGPVATTFIYGGEASSGGFAYGWSNGADVSQAFRYDTTNGAWFVAAPLATFRSSGVVGTNDGSTPLALLWDFAIGAMPPGAASADITTAIREYMWIGAESQRVVVR